MRRIGSGILSAILVFMMVFSFTACSESEPAEGDTQVGAGIPKYIFLFIGDGMSYSQVQAASYYLGTLSANGGVVNEDLSFMEFPVAGSAQTYDSTSFAPDSASTASSIASGIKTDSGVLNMDSTRTIAYETIAEKLKNQLDYKVGVISSVNLNHATPAAFYAHQASRNNYYEIGLELIESGFDYFAGGAFISPLGSRFNQPHLHTLAEDAGYTVVTTYRDAEALTPESGKAILVAEATDGGGAMNYAIDAEPGEWSLADYVSKGIDMLYNDTGFFMMVEGGKIDWACHANDAATSIRDVIALDEAVAVAVEFYNEHPEDTLILVTGDHETGGLTLGFATTNYDTFFTNIAQQEISYDVFSSTFVPRFRRESASFEDVLVDIGTQFGLVPSSNASAAAHRTLVLTAYEYEMLERAYERTMANTPSRSQEDYRLYGTYDPLTVAITHLLNNKSGIGWTSWSHTGAPVPVFATGAGADGFSGYYDNTDIFNKLAALTGVQ